MTGTPGGVALEAPSALQQRIARALFSEAKLLQIFVRKEAALSELAGRKVKLLGAGDSGRSGGKA